MERLGLRLLPSKKNPRVKRWQANNQRPSLGKAAAIIDVADIANSNPTLAPGKLPSVPYFNEVNGVPIITKPVAEANLYNARREVGSAALLQAMGIPTVDYGLIMDEGKAIGVYSPVQDIVSLGRVLNVDYPQIMYDYYHPDAFYWKLKQDTGEDLRRPTMVPRAKFLTERVPRLAANWGYNGDQIVKGLGQQMAISILLDDRDRHINNIGIDKSGKIYGLDYGFAYPPQISTFGNKTKLHQQSIYGTPALAHGEKTYHPDSPLFLSSKSGYHIPTDPKERVSALRFLLRYSHPQQYKEGMEEVLDAYVDVDWDEVLHRQPVPDEHLADFLKKRKASVVSPGLPQNRLAQAISRIVQQAPNKPTTTKPNGGKANLSKFVLYPEQINEKNLEIILNEPVARIEGFGAAKGYLGDYLKAKDIMGVAERMAKETERIKEFLENSDNPRLQESLALHPIVSHWHIPLHSSGSYASWNEPPFGLKPIMGLDPVVAAMLELEPFRYQREMFYWDKRSHAPEQLPWHEAAHLVDVLQSGRVVAGADDYPSLTAFKGFKDNIENQRHAIRNPVLERVPRLRYPNLIPVEYISVLTEVEVTNPEDIDYLQDVLGEDIRGPLRKLFGNTLPHRPWLKETP